MTEEQFNKIQNQYPKPVFGECGNFIAMKDGVKRYFNTYREAYVFMGGENV